MKSKSPRTPKLKVVPRWDAANGVFWWSNHKVREFGRHAPAQFAVLTEFQNKKWARSIDASGIIPPKTKRKKLWLHNNVGNLNRGMALIRFHVDVAKFRISWSTAKKVSC